MNRFDLGTSINIALVAGLTAALTPWALDQAAAATPGKVLRPAQAAALAVPQVLNNVSSMPMPQLADMPPELQGHNNIARGWL
jgi:hypothetical protein